MPNEEWGAGGSLKGGVRGGTGGGKGLISGRGLG